MRRKRRKGFFSGFGDCSPSPFSERSSSMRCCCSRAATPESRKAATKASRTPLRSPQILMQSPPRIGPRAMGMRRTNECIETPMVRLFMGKTLAIRLMVAGREMAVQERKKTAPTSTACHSGISMTKRNPHMAIMLNTSNARLVPTRSER